MSDFKIRNQGETVIIADPQSNDHWPYFVCPKCGAGNITRTFNRCIDCGVKLKWKTRKQNKEGSMILNEKQRKEFEQVTRPLIEWLNVPENAHPHCHVVVDNSHAELSEGICCFHTEEYLRD